MPNDLDTPLPGCMRRTCWGLPIILKLKALEFWVARIQCADPSLPATVMTVTHANLPCITPILAVVWLKQVLLFLIVYLLQIYSNVLEQNVSEVV